MRPTAAKSSKGSTAKPGVPPQTETARGSATKSAAPPLALTTFESFSAHPWLAKLRARYERDAALSYHAITRVVGDLKEFNDAHLLSTGRVAFTTVEARVKTPESFFRRVYEACLAGGAKSGVTPTQLERFYEEVKDICGVRFACPYFDEIEPRIADLRSKFLFLGYATDLQGDLSLADKNYLEIGNAVGYRSYHFYMNVPTVIDIFGAVELRLCEIQARSELQHVWAVKSHDLLYKPDSGWSFADKHVVTDMKALSQSLRAADQSLVSIRDRAKPPEVPHAT